MSPHHGWIRRLTSLAVRILLLLLICGAPVDRDTIRQVRQFVTLMHSPEWHVERFHGDGDFIVVTVSRVLPHGRRALEPTTFEFNDPLLAWLPFGIVIGLFVALLAGIFPFFRTAIDFLSNPFRFYALQWVDEAAEGRSPFLEKEYAPWLAIIVWNVMGVLLWFAGIPDLIDKGHTFLVWVIVLMTIPGVIMLIERLAVLFVVHESPSERAAQ